MRPAGSDLFVEEYRDVELRFDDQYGHDDDGATVSPPLFFFLYICVCGLSGFVFFVLYLCVFGLFFVGFNISCFVCGLAMFGLFFALFFLFSFI